MSDRSRAWRDGAVPSAEQLERLFGGDVPAWPGTRWPRAYPGRDSGEHARRLLNRAVNPDRPGQEVLRRLAGAVGHAIERLPDRRIEPPPRGWCSVYEHAFLLADHSELCLYEVEHDATEDGELVCEVYADEATAGRAARRCARAARERARDAEAGQPQAP